MATLLGKAASNVREPEHETSHGVHSGVVRVVAAPPSRNRTIEFRIRTRAGLTDIGSSVRRGRVGSKAARPPAEPARQLDVSAACRLDAARFADISASVRAYRRRVQADDASLHRFGASGL